MVEWTIVNSDKINRIAYQKSEKLLHIGFVDNETDTIFLNVPEALYKIFIEAKSPDQFYTQCVEGYFDVIYPGTISMSRQSKNTRVNK